MEGSVIKACIERFRSGQPTSPRSRKPIDANAFWWIDPDKSQSSTTTTTSSSSISQSTAEVIPSVVKNEQIIEENYSPVNEDDNKIKCEGNSNNCDSSSEYEASAMAIFLNAKISGNNYNNNNNSNSNNNNSVLAKNETNNSDTTSLTIQNNQEKSYIPASMVDNDDNGFNNSNNNISPNATTLKVSPFKLDHFFKGDASETGIFESDDNIHTNLQLPSSLSIDHNDHITTQFYPPSTLLHESHDVNFQNSTNTHEESNHHFHHHGKSNEHHHKSNHRNEQSLLKVNHLESVITTQSATQQALPQYLSLSPHSQSLLPAAPSSSSLHKKHSDSGSKQTAVEDLDEYADRLLRKCNALLNSFQQSAHASSTAQNGNRINKATHSTKAIVSHIHGHSSSSSSRHTSSSSGRSSHRPTSVMKNYPNSIISESDSASDSESSASDSESSSSEEDDDDSISSTASSSSVSSSSTSSSTSLSSPIEISTTSLAASAFSTSNTAIKHINKSTATRMLPMSLHSPNKFEDKLHHPPHHHRHHHQQQKTLTTTQGKSIKDATHHSSHKTNNTMTSSVGGENDEKSLFMYLSDDDDDDDDDEKEEEDASEAYMDEYGHNNKRSSSSSSFLDKHTNPADKLHNRIASYESSQSPPHHQPIITNKKILDTSNSDTTTTGVSTTAKAEVTMKSALPSNGLFDDDDDDGDNDGVVFSTDNPYIPPDTPLIRNTLYPYTNNNPKPLLYTPRVELSQVQPYLQSDPILSELWSNLSALRIKIKNSQQTPSTDKFK